MCLILLAWQAHPQYPLIVAANRDEFHARPAAPAAWWGEHPDVLAGRDLAAGGTWLGITRSGRFAALTNFRAPGRQRPDAASRGALVLGLLRDAPSVPDALAALDRDHAAYNGFNLLYGDGERVGVFESVSGVARVLDPGIYGLSNHLLDTPWPKVRAAKARLAEAILRLPDTDALLELLRDDRAADDHELPRTGLDIEWERLLSSAFIRAPGYGTRCSTIVCVGGDGAATFDEWTWNIDGEEQGRRSERFPLASP